MKVLIVDDHALIRDGLALLLPTLDRNFIPLGAESCKAAFALLENEPDIGVVLMDLGLPGMSGTDGISVMRAQYPALPIIALSGTQDRATILACIRSGAMGFIPKAYSGERLFGALQYVLVYKGTFLPAEMLLDGEASVLAPEAEPNTAHSIDGSISPKSLGLTERQADVLYLVLQGKPNKVIARELHIEDTTVRSHVTAVLRALNVTTRTEAVIAAHKLKLVFSKEL
jgi:DNA-binding NarL/FixJ family response regulator